MRRSRTTCSRPTRPMRRARSTGSRSSSRAPRRHRGVRVTEADGAFALEVHSRSTGERARRGRHGRAARASRSTSCAWRSSAGRRRRRRRRRRRADRLLTCAAARHRASPAGRSARAVGVPRLRLVAVARQQDGVEGAVDRPCRGGLGRVGDDLPRRRRSARSDRCSTARRHLFPRAADLPAGPAVGRRGARHLLVPRRATARSGSRSRCSSRRSASLAIGAPRALEAFAYRYPPGETVEERFLVHRTVFPRDFLEEFGFVTLRAQGRVELCRLELGGLAAGRGGATRQGAPRRAGGVHPDARAGPAAVTGLTGRAPSRRR